MSRTRRSLAAVVLPAVLPAVLLLSACGGDAGGTTTASPTSSAAAGAEGGFRGGADFRKIQECLTAAGISLPTPSGGFRRPDGTPPSGRPNRTPPSGAPRGGGFGQMFRNPQVQAALKACGITAPTARPS